MKKKEFKGIIENARIEAEPDRIPLIVLEIRPEKCTKWTLYKDMPITLTVKNSKVFIKERKK